MARLERIDPPRYLYRYRSLTGPGRLEREINALTQPYIWCSKLSSLNDPMEGFFTPSSRLKLASDYEEAIREIMEESSNLGISSFTDTHQSELMWAHYADNYAGICIGYNSKRLINALNDGYTVVRVGYGDYPPEIAINDPIPPPRKMLSYKKISWSYEREWRVVGPRGEAQIDKDCIQTVFLGLRIDQNFRARLLDALNGRKIDVWEMEMKPREYKHEFQQIR